MTIIIERKSAFGLIECIDCIMGRVTRDVARRRSLKCLSYCKQFIQNRHKGHIGRDRYKTEIVRNFVVVYLDARIQK